MANVDIKGFQSKFVINLVENGVLKPLLEVAKNGCTMERWEAIRAIGGLFNSLSLCKTDSKWSELVNSAAISCVVDAITEIRPQYLIDEMNDDSWRKNKKEEKQKQNTSPLKRWVGFEVDIISRGSWDQDETDKNAPDICTVVRRTAVKTLLAIIKAIQCNPFYLGNSVSALIYSLKDGDFQTRLYAGQALLELAKSNSNIPILTQENINAIFEELTNNRDLDHSSYYLLESLSILRSSVESHPLLPKLLQRCKHITKLPSPRSAPFFFQKFGKILDPG